MTWIIVWAIVSILAELGKKLGINQVYVVTFLSLICATIRYFITPENQQQIITSWQEIVWSATVLYNIFKMTSWKKEDEIDKITVERLQEYNQ